MNSPVEETVVPAAIVVEKAKARHTRHASKTHAHPHRKKQNHVYRKARPGNSNREEHRRSKFHARGITYSSPFKCYMGALITVCFLVTLLLSLLIPVHAFLTKSIEIADIAILMLMVFSGILYLTVALQCRCRTCRVQLFSLRHFLRHKNAHHIPLLGYNIPTGLHILLFFWFRCQACGTSQKLAQK